MVTRRGRGRHCAPAALDRALLGGPSTSPLGISGAHVEISDDAVQFGAFVLAHCAAIAASNEPGDLICPFAVFVKDGQRQSVHFESDTQDEAVEKGWNHFEQCKGSVEYWAFGREGYYTFSEGRWDVLVTSVWKAGMSDPITLLHRFTPTSQGAFRLKGKTEVLIDQQLFSQPDHPFFEKAVAKGIASHPKGQLWSSWLEG